MDLPLDTLILSQENEKQDLVTGSSIVFKVTSSSSGFLFTPDVCRNIKFRISGTFQSGKEKVKQRDDLSDLSQDQKIFRVGFDLLYPGQYKVVVTFCNKNVTNSPFKFHVSSEVEIKHFKKVFTEMEKHEMESVLVKQVEDQLKIKLEDKTSTANQTQEVTADNKTKEVTTGNKVNKVAPTISEPKPPPFDPPSRSNLCLRRPVHSSVSVYTIPNVTVSTVGTPVLTTNKIPVTYHYKPSLTTESLSSVSSPLTSRPKSSIQDLPWSPLCLVTDVAARTEPFRSSFTINEGTELDELHHPIGLCLLNNGNLVVASTFEHKVKLYLPSGVLQSIVQIPGRRFYKPTDMTALASGHFAVRDNNGLMIFSSEGRFLWKLETEDKSKCTGLAQDDTGHLVTIQKPKRGEAASLIFFDLNTGIITNRMDLNHVVREEDRWRSNCKFLTYCRGLLYVTDLGMDKVYILDASARLVRVFGTTGDGPGCFNDPAGLGVDGVGNMVVADSRNHRVCLFTKEGKFVSNLNLSPKVMRPSGLLLDRVNKELYVLNLNGAIALMKYSLQ